MKKIKNTNKKLYGENRILYLDGSPEVAASENIAELEVREIVDGLMSGLEDSEDIDSSISGILDYWGQAFEEAGFSLELDKKSDNFNEYLVNQLDEKIDLILEELSRRGFGQRDRFNALFEALNRLNKELDQSPVIKSRQKMYDEVFQSNGNMKRPNEIKNDLTLLFGLGGQYEEVDTSFLVLPSRESVILLHRQERQKRSRGNIQDIMQYNVNQLAILQVLIGDRENPNDDGHVFSDKDSEWYVDDQDGNTFNCHTFSIGERIGLTRYDWLEGQPIPEFGNPMQEVLDEYFTPVRTIDVRKKPNFLQELENDEELRPGDVIVFTKKEGEMLYHLHSGRILKKDGENWIISKMGPTDLIVSTIEAVSKADNYSDFDQVSIHRFTPPR